MSQNALSAEILAFRTCATCYKAETKELKYQRCGACQKPAYCSKECQKKDWPTHKKTCKLEMKNRESLPAKGTDERNTLSDIKKWFAKHTQLLAYAATHAMKLHDPANLSMITTHMLAVELEPAPSGKNADFVYKNAALRETADPSYGLTAPARAGLAASAAGLAPVPISVELGTALQHVARFGPPDNDWNGFLERAINKILGDKDKTRTERLQQLM